MLSARRVFQEILDHDESFQLFCSIAASGESQGGWENGRIAALIPESLRELAPKVVRHGADEDKHGRIFTALLRKRGLKALPVPLDVDYTVLLERAGIGLSHALLKREEQLTEEDIVAYLAHSRVTEQRASEQMAQLLRYFGDHPEVGKAVRIIALDEASHLAYCQEELMRLSRQGHERTIRRMLRESALTEIRLHRDVSIAVMTRMGRLLGWSWLKVGVLRLSIVAIWAYERVVGWRRMVTLRMPERRNALGGGTGATPRAT